MQIHDYSDLLDTIQIQFSPDWAVFSVACKNIQKVAYQNSWLYLSTVFYQKCNLILYGFVEYPLKAALFDLQYILYTS